VSTSAERQPPPRIQIENPRPRVDCGRYAPKRTPGETVAVSADIFTDGHEIVRAVVRRRAPGQDGWDESPMRAVDAHHAGVRWEGAFSVEALGRHAWTIEAWVDQLASWRDELRRKVDAGQEDLSGEFSEGAVLLEEAAGRASQADRATIERALAVVRDAGATSAERAAAALADDVARAADRHPDRSRSSILPEPLEVHVDAVRARFGSWYELFPRSWGGFQGVRRQLPRLAELGFDVVYFPPIHPIGRTNRKGRNNALVAGPGDPGSPYAIGDETGGHDAIHPDLGTLEDFDALVADARELGLQVALDLAINCSADHPWLTEHPEWFHRRPDGTLKYAENPPKKYQDIYNVNWDSEDWRGLWQALLDVVLHWVRHGVHIFRVDNPHTKPFAFWEWLIRRVHAEQPDVVFLAEAFTRRAVMRTLGKLGFDQSYTYFTWKTTRYDLTEYVSELAHSGEEEYFRPNFFTNTPDILTEELVVGGPPKFRSRLVLASTLSPSYGIYSGFEHYENVPVRPGSEEYLNSEKYEIKQRALDGPLLPMVGRLNQIRREHPALQHFSNITFLETENDALVAYAKRWEDDVVLVVVSLDPGATQAGTCIVPYDLGLPPTFGVEDLLTRDYYTWHMGRNFVQLEPGGAHVLAVHRS
jgi:starch synthase (maltosyl-transferring)